MSFRMQLASFPQGIGSLLPLHFGTMRRGADATDHPFHPVLAATVGAELEYGNLFAYLFRRFGSPNQAWDHTTELARYLLTTPRPDLYLSVVPRVDGRSLLSVEFLAPAAAGQAATAFVRGAIEAWEGRAIAHRASRGMPPWLLARGRSLSQDEGAPSGRRAHAVELWRAALRVTPADGKARARQVLAFLRQCQDAYARIETRPPELQRAVMLKDWDDADPLKPYALAAARALAALTREVRVGTEAIDVFGPRPRTSRALAGAATVTLGQGELLKRHGAHVGELLQRIASLGKDRQREALARAIAALRQERTR